MVHGSSLDFQISALPSELLPASCTNDPLSPPSASGRLLKPYHWALNYLADLGLRIFHICAPSPQILLRSPHPASQATLLAIPLGSRLLLPPAPLPHRVSSSSGVSVFPLLQPRPSPDPPACIASRLIYYNSATILRQPSLSGASLPPTPICLTRARLTFLSQRPGHLVCWIKLSLPS